MSAGEAKPGASFQRCLAKTMQAALLVPRKGRNQVHLQKLTLGIGHSPAQGLEETGNLQLGWEAAPAFSMSVRSHSVIRKLV